MNDFEHPVSYIPRPQATACVWDGQGLPPVWTVCDIRFPHWEHWIEAEILCYGKRMVFVRQKNAFEGTMALDAIQFRLIRTAEQIADEARQIATQKIMVDAGITDSAFKDDPEAWVWAAALYDAGYRKEGDER